MVYTFGLLGSCFFFLNSSLCLLFSRMLSAACVRKSKVFQQGLASVWFSLAVLHSFEQLTIAYSCMLVGFFLLSLFAFYFVSVFLIVTLCGPGCPGTCCVDQAGLEPEGIHLSLPPMY